MDRITILTAGNGYYVRKGETSWVLKTTEELLVKLLDILPATFAHSGYDRTLSLFVPKREPPERDSS